MIPAERFPLKGAADMSPFLKEYSSIGAPLLVEATADIEA